MHFLVLPFLPRHLSAKDGVRPLGWVGFCSGLVWPLSSSYTACLQPKNLKIIQMLKDPSSYWPTNAVCYWLQVCSWFPFPFIQTACISFRVGIWGTQSLWTTALSPEVPFGANSCWKKNTKPSSCQSPSLLPLQAFPNRQRFCTGFLSLCWYFPS